MGNLGIKSLLVFSALFIVLWSPLLAKAQFDTNYVHLTKNKFNVSPLFEFYKTNINVIAFAPEFTQYNDKVDRTFSSKSNMYLGIGASFYRFGFSLSFKLPITDVPELKKAKSISFIGGYSYRKFYGDFQYLQYHGFMEKTYTYEEDSLIETSKLGVNNKYRQIGASLYFFTSKKYNYDANFKNYNIQKKSTISPLFSIGFDYFDLQARLEDIDTIKSDIVTRKVVVFSSNIVTGMAASWVYKEKWFASAVFALGLAINYNEIEGSISDDYGINFFPSTQLKMACGYNSKRYALSINYLYDNDLVYFYQQKIGVNHHYVAFKFAYRFDTKFLGKAARFL